MRPTDRAFDCLVFGNISNRDLLSKSRLGRLSRILSGNKSSACVDRSLLGSRLGRVRILEIPGYLRKGSLVGEITILRESCMNGD